MKEISKDRFLFISAVFGWAESVGEGKGWKDSGKKTHIGSCLVGRIVGWNGIQVDSLSTESDGFPIRPKPGRLWIESVRDDYFLGFCHSLGFSTEQ